MRWYRIASGIAAAVVMLPVTQVARAVSVSIGNPAIGCTSTQYQSITTSSTIWSGTWQSQATPNYMGGWYTSDAGSNCGYGPFWGPYGAGTGDLAPELPGVGNSYFALVPGTGYGIDDPYPGYNHENPYPTTFDYLLPATLTIWSDYTNNLTAKIVPGQKYTATVAVGHPANWYTSPAYTLQVLTSANPPANDDGTTGWMPVASSSIAAGQVASGTWTDLSTSFTSTAGEAGQYVEIMITMNNFYCEKATNTVYGMGVLNNVRLDYAATPEPATLTLLVTGLLAALAYTWRRNRSS